MGLIAYGKITKAHGLYGGVRLLPFSRRFESLNSIQRIFIDRTPGQEPEGFYLKECTPEKDSAIIRLGGVETID